MNCSKIGEYLINPISFFYFVIMSTLMYWKVTIQIEKPRRISWFSMTNLNSPVEKWPVNEKPTSFYHWNK